MTGCRHVFEYAYVPDGSPTNTFWHKCNLCGIRVVGDARKMWEECAAAIAERDVEIETLRQIVARLRREIDTNQLAAVRYAEAKDAEIERLKQWCSNEGLTLPAKGAE